MTSKGKCAVAYLLFLSFFLIVPSVVTAACFPVGFAIGSAVLSSLVFMFWGFTFSCPRCGEPFLWEIRGGWKIPRLFPRRTCRVCELPTNEPYVREKVLE